MENEFTSLFGTLDFDGSKSDFYYSDGKLTVILTEETFRKLTYEQQWINQIMVFLSTEKKPITAPLKGVTKDLNRPVYFFFQPFAYSFHSKCDSFGPSFRIVIYVDLVFLAKKRIEDQTVNSFSLYSKQFHQFLGICPKRAETFSTDLRCSIDYSSPSLKMSSEFSIGEKFFRLKPNIWFNELKPFFEFIPGLTVYFNDNDEKEIPQIYFAAIDFLRFAFMRKDISPDMVCFNMNHFEGEIDCPRLKKIPYIPDYDFNHSSGSLRWPDFYKHAARLFCLIFEKKVYLDHIPQDFEGRKYVDYTSISKISSAFEYEEKASVAQARANCRIEEQVNKLNHSNANDSFCSKEKKEKNKLGERIEAMLDKHEKSLSSLKKKLGITRSNKEIAIDCANARNKVDHGDYFDLNEPDFHAESIAVLNALVYSLQLTRVGYLEDEINNLIAELYKF